MIVIMQQEHFKVLTQWALGLWFGWMLDFYFQNLVTHHLLHWQSQKTVAFTHSLKTQLGKLYKIKVLIVAYNIIHEIINYTRRRGGEPPFMILSNTLIQTPLYSNSPVKRCFYIMLTSLYQKGKKKNQQRQVFSIVINWIYIKLCRRRRMVLEIHNLRT